MQSRTQSLLKSALCAALIAVTAQIVVPIGAVPFSMAVFGVILAGAMQRPGPAAASVAAYLALGLCGVPVFARFAAGPGVLLGPTGGYLIGYFLLALAASFAANGAHRRPAPAGAFPACPAAQKTRPAQPMPQPPALPFAARLAIALAGLAGLYLFGTGWFMMLTGTGFVQSLLLCVVPFALPDAIKAVLALWLATALQKRLAAARLA